MSANLDRISETSLVVNIMHEILVDRWKKGKPSIAICPTQRYEKMTGYDVALPGFHKLLFFQFKRCIHRNGRAPISFPISSKQHNVLLTYPSNTSFYVLPNYRSHTELSRDKRKEFYQKRAYEILNNTWFVDAHDVPRRTKKITKNDLLSGTIRPQTWINLTREIDSCKFGFIIKFNKSTEQWRLLAPDGEKEVPELTLPGGFFSMFYTDIT